MATATHEEPLTYGRQTVHFQDARDLANVPNESIDFIVTSPPYWNLKNYGHEDQIGDSSYDQYLTELDAVWAESYRVAKASAVMAINIGSRRQKGLFYPIAFDLTARMKGWRLIDVLIWYIPNALPQPNAYREKFFDNKFEYVLLFSKNGDLDFKFHKPRVPQKYATADPRKHKLNPLGRCLGNILRIPAYRPPNVKKLGYHVAAFPEELIAVLLHSFTDVGDTVLDPFVGSGTTLKVAEGMGRSGIGVELNADYRSLIAARLRERFEVPDWRDLDIIHSASSVPGQAKSRKIHLLR